MMTREDLEKEARDLWRQVYMNTPMDAFSSRRIDAANVAKEEYLQVFGHHIARRPRDTLEMGEAVFLKIAIALVDLSTKIEVCRSSNLEWVSIKIHPDHRYESDDWWRKILTQLNYAGVCAASTTSQNWQLLNGNLIAHEAGPLVRVLSEGHALEDAFVHVADYPFDQIAITFRAECWKLPEERIKHES